MPKTDYRKMKPKTRLDKYGKNDIEEKKTSSIVKFLSNFWGPIPWMIEVACILAAISGHWEDFFVVLALLLINVVVSFWHEHKADKSIQALKETLSPTARVIRDGNQQKIDSRELVPGDIIIIRIGDVIPADALLLDDQTIMVDESSLTGESVPVDKEEGAMVYSGTSAKRGKAHAIVTATGTETKFAKTVELVESAGTQSHFRKAIMRISYFLIAIALFLIIVIIIISIFIRHNNVWNVILFALGLTLAAIPAALPAVLSVTMSIGANRLAKMKAVISRLTAMDEMAGLDLLCSDKTGTLTKNELQLHEPVLFEAKNKEELTLLAALTADREEPGPIDQAILNALDTENKLDDYEMTHFEPFDPTHKRATAKVKHNGKTFSVAKGAPQVIMDLVKGDSKLKKKVSDKVQELAENGFRALGVARRKSKGSWHYLGILSLLDPPREDSADVVKEAKNHHIEVRMVTGDHPAIGSQIAGKIGLGKDIKAANELFGKESSESGKSEINMNIHKKVLAADGFAEVTPEHKFRIIKHYQAEKHIVGMTGDGVNDAPALKQANVGIAVADASDAARSAAALVLTEQGLGVIIRGIEEARRIFERMTGYATYRITETIRLLLFISASVLIFNFYPLSPIMIVLLAILNDIPIMAIAWDNTRTSQYPVRWSIRRVLITSLMIGITGVISSFLLFWYVDVHTALSNHFIRTMMFLKLLVAGHMTLYITRSLGWFWQKPWPSFTLLGALETTQIIGTLFAVYGFGLFQPIGWQWTGVVWGYALFWMFILDGVKVLAHKILRNYMGLSTEGN
jgi:H+-transporting ATPase